MYAYNFGGVISTHVDNPLALILETKVSQAKNLDIFFEGHDLSARFEPRNEGDQMKP